MAWSTARIIARTASTSCGRIACGLGSNTRRSTSAPPAARILALASVRPGGTHSSPSAVVISSGVPSRPCGCVSSESSPISPPVRAATPPYRRGWRAAYSSVRQAPWEKPASTIRSAGQPAPASRWTAASQASSACDSHGSLSATGAVKRCGYHVRPAATGTSMWTSSSASRTARSSIVSGHAPRPCTRIAAPAASSAGGPDVSGALARCGLPVSARKLSRYAATRPRRARAATPRARPRAAAG